MLLGEIIVSRKPIPRVGKPSELTEFSRFFGTSHSFPRIPGFTWGFTIPWKSLDFQKTQHFPGDSYGEVLGSLDGGAFEKQVPSRIFSVTSCFSLGGNIVLGEESEERV